MIIHRPQKNENMRGFSLLELLIAMVLLAIGLLAAATMQGVAMNANSSGNRICMATVVGEQVVEDISSLKNTDPLLNSAVVNATYDRMFDQAANATTASTVSIPGAGMFSAQYDIVPNTPMIGTTQITVRVFYNGSTTPAATFSTYKMVI